jgi:hypothetical protein
MTSVAIALLLLLALITPLTVSINLYMLHCFHLQQLEKQASADHITINPLENEVVAITTDRDSQAKHVIELKKEVKKRTNTCSVRLLSVMAIVVSAGALGVELCMLCIA